MFKRRIEFIYSLIKKIYRKAQHKKRHLRRTKMSSYIFEEIIA